MSAALANDPLICNLSTNDDGVMSFPVGISLYSFSYSGPSKYTALFALSLTFPFDHFYFIRQ